MEVRREPLPPAPAGTPAVPKHTDPQALLVRQLNASQLLRGGDLSGANRPAHLKGAELERYVQDRMLTTTLMKSSGSCASTYGRWTTRSSAFNTP